LGSLKSYCEGTSRQTVRKLDRRAFRHAKRVVIDEGLQDMQDEPERLTRKQIEEKQRADRYAQEEKANTIQGTVTNTRIFHLWGSIPYEGSNVLATSNDQEFLEREARRLNALAEAHREWEAQRRDLPDHIRWYGDISDEPIRVRYDHYYVGWTYISHP
jgi:hypothetical protein